MKIWRCKKRASRYAKWITLDTCEMLPISMPLSISFTITLTFKNTILIPLVVIITHQCTKFDNCSIMRGYISELHAATSLHGIAVAMQKLNYRMRIDGYAISVLVNKSVQNTQGWNSPRAEISMMKLVLNSFITKNKSTAATSRSNRKASHFTKTNRSPKKYLKFHFLFILSVSSTSYASTLQPVSRIETLHREPFGELYNAVTVCQVI